MATKERNPIRESIPFGEDLGNAVDPLNLFSREVVDTAGLERREALADAFAADLAALAGQLDFSGAAPQLGLDAEAGISGGFAPLPQLDFTQTNEVLATPRPGEIPEEEKDDLEKLLDLGTIVDPGVGLAIRGIRKLF